MAMLSVSCFLSIVLRIAERIIARRYEVLKHATALLLLLTFAIVGAENRVYYSEAGYCWVFNYSYFTTCIIFFSILGIYLKIRKRVVRMRADELKPQKPQKKFKR